MMAQFIIEEDSQLHDFVRNSLSLKDFTIFPLAGDASSRKYYRVVSGEDSWVLAKWEPVAEPDKYPFISIQKHLFDNKINVPKIFAADYSAGLYLQEDLGDLTLERKFWENMHQENVLPFYKVTLDQLAILHRLSLDKSNLDKCTAYSVRFDTEKFKWELNYTLTYLFKTFLKIQPQNEEALQKEFELLASTLAQIPSVLTHRDFHSRNLMIKSNKIYLIDFQDARMGPPQYDLVSLLHDSYVELSETSQTALLEYYLGIFPEALKMYDNKKMFLYYFNLQMLQRCFKACGTFAAINAQRGDNRYLKYLPHTLGKVRTALMNTTEFPLLKEMVENIQLPDLEAWP